MGETNPYTITIFILSIWKIKNKKLNVFIQIDSSSRLSFFFFFFSPNPTWTTNSQLIRAILTFICLLEVPQLGSVYSLALLLGFNFILEQYNHLIRRAATIRLWHKCDIFCSPFTSWHLSISRKMHKFKMKTKHSIKQNTLQDATTHRLPLANKTKKRDSAIGSQPDPTMGHGLTVDLATGSAMTHAWVAVGEARWAYGTLAVRVSHWQGKAAAWLLRGCDLSGKVSGLWTSTCYKVGRC